MKTIRIGLAGAGFIARIHLEALRRVVGVPVEIAGILGRSGAPALAEEFGIGRIYDTYEQMLADPAIDAVDILTPNIHHAEMCVKAAEAGKHIICEKPLTGAFEREPASMEELYRRAVERARGIVEAAERNNVLICYAEDFVYAPAVEKARRLLAKGGGAILEMRSEESHSGSHAAYAKHWELAGGGSLLRLGAHPVGLVLHMKEFEGRMRSGRPIGVKSVLADMGNLTKTQAFQNSGRKWVVDDWHDVEDWSTVILTFEDGTKAVIHSNDITLGGVVNTLDIYSSNSVIRCKLTNNDAVRAYAPDSDVFGDEYILEKIQTKAGWTYPSPDEDWARGYPQEMQDFAEAIANNREPLSNGRLGCKVVEVIYAAYLSAQSGRRVELDDK
ncbi:MAG: Gfo/Idh/MocA family oxidoreductase [Clostridiales bacterium]|nr:Gfo/Idh/MocA family oxidoreductase [Clostridiales bacterium]